MTTNTKVPANMKQFTFQLKIALAELKLTDNELVIGNVFEYHATILLVKVYIKL